MICILAGKVYTDYVLLAGQRMKKDGILGRNQRGEGVWCLETGCYDMAASLATLLLHGIEYY